MYIVKFVINDVEFMCSTYFFNLEDAFEAAEMASKYLGITVLVTTGNDVIIRFEAL